MNKQDFCNAWLCDGRPVLVPHDAMQEEGRSADAPSGSGCGYFLGGKYTYEKTFSRPNAPHSELLFEGVYRNAKIFVNGYVAGEHIYGYTPFTINLDPFLQDGKNTVTVMVDNSMQPNSRWYTGSGIYRPVWLLTGEDIRIESIQVETVDSDSRIINARVHTTGGIASVTISDGDKIIATGAPGELFLPGTELWSAESPKLYTCRAEVRLNGKIVDTLETSFGIRTLHWDGKGFYVNGKRTLLKGGCIHHDNGILGARAFPEAERRKVALLKAAGFNAIRCAHNPCSQALLDACDAYGIYVIDEGWDMWFQRKTKYDYATEMIANWKNDLSAIVDKDRNHPSVIAYSIGNELSEPAKPEGLALAEDMVCYLHDLDHTRPVTAGMNLSLLSRAFSGKVQYSDADPNTEPMNSSLLFNKMASVIGTGMNNASKSSKIDAQVSPMLDTLDIAGYNYASGRYKTDASLHPERLIIGSETFPQDIVKNWRMVEELPNLAGDFMWTAIDYLGEAGIGAWSYTKDGLSFTKPYPWLLGDVGVLDLLGNPNGELFIAQCAWHLLDTPKMAVRPANHPGIKVGKQTWRGTNAIPSWAWQGCDGNKTVVEIYTDAPKASLYLNGRKIGKKKVVNYVAAFRVKYVPGKLEGIALNDDGTERGRCVLQSAGSAKPIITGPKLAASGEVVFLPVAIMDEKGIIESNADCLLSVEVSGCELLGFGSANPRTEESYLNGAYTTYYGQALIAVRCKEAGTVRVTLKHQETICDIVTISVKKR